MQIQNNYSQNNFQSTIRPVTERKFYQNIVGIYPAKVDYPWTIRESKTAARVCTDGIYDCTAVGLTNGDKAFLMHISPTEPDNFDLSKIKNFLLTQIDKLRNEYLQGLILGGKINNGYSPNSIKYFDNFCDVLDKEKIPFSIFKGGPFTNHLAYSTVNDTWLIGSERILEKAKDYLTPENALRNIFDEVKISELDEVKW